MIKDCFKFALTAILIFTLISCDSNKSVTDPPETPYGQLQVNGIQLQDSNGQAIILRGTSFGWHNWWPRFYNADVVKWLAEDWGCNVVRAAMGIEPEGAYLDQPTSSLATIKAVVDGAIQNGIYVIIDWHSHNLNHDEAIYFFQQMVQTYGKYPNVIYEIVNEPDQESWAAVKSYAIDVIQAIRAIDPDNLILVGSPQWDQSLDLVAADPITGYDNLMYTMHFYAATHHEWLRDRCEVALDAGIPLFVSECAGMEATGDGPIDYDSWHTWMDWLEQHQIGWVFWDIADKDETCSALLPSAGSNGNWSESDLKEWGIQTRALIRQKNLGIE